VKRGIYIRLRYDEQEDCTRPWIEGSAYASKIDFIIGDAMEQVPKLGKTFDMAFIDGDKRCYIDYFTMLMNYMSKGGYIFADNTLWDGHVLSTPDRNDTQTIGIMAFNDFIAADHRVEKVILPLRDGLTIMRKIE
jgi:caffeoyl-CoA O-methyltransferase